MHSFIRAVERNARNWPEKPAYTFLDRSVSNAELLERVRALAAAFAAQGVGRGDVVALLLGNCPQFLEATLALNGLGAIWLPLNYRLALDEWRYIVDHAEATLLITEADHHEAGASLLELPALRGAWTISDAVPDGWSSFDAELEAHRAAPLPTFVELGPDDVQRLMYTSGTTARPKGVPLTYGNLHWKNVAHLVEFGITSDDRVLIAGPMYHVGAMDLPATGVLYAGGDWVILPHFDPELVLSAIEQHRVTIVWLPPAMVNMILAHPGNDRHDLRSLRLVISGGEKMPEPLVQRILDQFPNAWFADAYGLTETVSGDTFLDRDNVLTKLGSVGRVCAHLDLKIADDDGNELPPGERGEICLRGPKVFGGYWRDPEATARAIRDGWFHTGDVGRVDEDGYLYIDDRKKDLIISGGENIASPEVERVLYEHPSVLEAAVIGMPDPKWGEVPMAVVVRRDGAELTAEELASFCTGKLARFKVPKRVEFVDALPRTPSGKVLKRTLREELLG